MTLFVISFSIVSDPLALLIAAYGAVLSTYLLLYKVSPKLKVTMSTAILNHPSFEGRLYVKAVNVRDTAVTVDTPYILLPKKHLSSEILKIPLIHTDSGVKFPLVLEPGKSCAASIGRKELAQALTDKNSRTVFSTKEHPQDATYAGKIKIRGMVLSAADKKYKSKKFVFDIDGALRSESDI